MNHYITSDNKIYGFDTNQSNLIPAGAVEIPTTFTMAQIPFITLVNGVPTFNQANYDATVKAEQEKEAEQATAKASALAKLTALGLTQAEVTALIGN